MGDNVYLGDRDSVRTPMQWKDRTAGGFSWPARSSSTCRYHRPEYHRDGQRRGAAPEPELAAVVDTPHHRPAGQHQVFGRGDIEFLLPENAKVLVHPAARRRDRARRRNLSALPRVNLDLHDHRGMVPVELFGGNEFAPIAEGGYNLTLGPYGFYWFSLQAQHHDALGQAPGPEELPVISVAEDWRQLFRGRSRARAALSRAWPGFFLRNRWYAGRTRTIRHVEVLDTVPSPPVGAVPPRSSRSCRSSTRTASRRPTSSAHRGGGLSRPSRSRRTTANAGVAWIDVAQWGQRLLLFDATCGRRLPRRGHPPVQAQPLVRPPTGRQLRTSTTPEPAHRQQLQRSHRGAPRSSRATPPQCSATRSCSRCSGGPEGVNPDLEIGRFLTERGFEASGAAGRRFEYQKGRANPHRRRDQPVRPQRGRRLALHPRCARPLLRVRAAGAARRQLEVPDWPPCSTPRPSRCPPRSTPSGPTSTRPRCWAPHGRAAPGARWATPEEFEPEPFTTLYQRSLYQSMRPGGPTLSLVRRMLPEVDEDGAVDARYVLDNEAGLLAAFGGAPPPHRRQPHPGARRLPPRPGAARRATS
jgi:maltose alpha-D-glucosyltransferase/alpha-amylase